MTASEANRQRVLTLLAVEWKQAREELKTIEKKAPTKRRGRVPKITDLFVQPYSLEQAGTSQTSEPASNNSHLLHQEEV
ncbi:MAG TPA: hypothetical protein VK578_10310 [Edaphobacter sp.]|jgi:hypothetical protein|nr:hypothetical protein [Edaphobacter sp.]